MRTRRQLVCAASLVPSPTYNGIGGTSVSVLDRSRKKLVTLE